MCRSSGQPCKRDLVLHFGIFNGANKRVRVLWAVRVGRVILMEVLLTFAVLQPRTGRRRQHQQPKHKIFLYFLQRLPHPSPFPAHIRMTLPRMVTLTPSCFAQHLPRCHPSGSLAIALHPLCVPPLHFGLLPPRLSLQHSLRARQHCHLPAQVCHSPSKVRALARHFRGLFCSRDLQCRSPSSGCTANGL